MRKLKQQQVRKKRQSAGSLLERGSIGSISAALSRAPFPDSGW